MKVLSYVVFVICCLPTRLCLLTTCVVVDVVSFLFVFKLFSSFGLCGFCDMVLFLNFDVYTVFVFA